MLLRTITVGVLALLAGAACDLDLQNPNAPTEEEVLGDIEGVIALAVGMQDQYASDIDTYVQAPALVSDEWGTQSRSLLAWTSLMTGENFDNSYGTVEGPWSTSYEVIKSAENLIAAAPNVGLGSGFQAGMTALGKLFKALALGQLYLHYERAPIDVSVTLPTPVDRDQVLQEAISLLESARSDLSGVAAADLSGFNSRVKGDGLDLANTIDAMLARLYLFAGQYQDAADAADRVDPTVLSVFDYASPDINPVHDLSFRAEYVAGLQTWANDAEGGDDRVDFWLNMAVAPQPNTDSLLYEFAQYTATGDPFPIYLPDEMKLIRAEALVRLGSGNYAEARSLVNEVRTQTTSTVNEPVAGLAALPDPALDTEDELLTQIAYERKYELYMQGLRWEDMRRFGALAGNTPWMEFMPLPQQECLANPNAGC